MRVTPLTERHCRQLAPNLRKADLIDCAAHDHNGLAALLTGMAIGSSWALVDEETGETRGAAGWSPSERTLWSLWSDTLTRKDQSWIMQNTVPGVRSCVIKAGQVGALPLINYVWEGNKLTLAWLNASKCFYIDRLQPHPYKGHNYLLFMAKPLEELPLV